MEGVHLECEFDWERLSALTALTALTLSEVEPSHIMRSMPAVLAVLPSLQHLKLSGAHLPGSKLLASFTGQLTHLELRTPGRDLPEVAHIAGMSPRLRTLGVSAYGNSAADRFRHLGSRIPNLFLW